MADEGPKLPLSLSLYDLLGYIAPGGILVLSVFVLERWALQLTVSGAPLASATIHTPIHRLLLVFAADVRAGGWLGTTIAGLAMLLTAYVSGHVIASVSSMLIERTLVFKGYGYPYESQLSFARDSDTGRSQWTAVSRAYHRGAFFWLNVYALSRVASLTSFPSMVGIDPAALVLVARAVGVLLLTLLVLKLWLGHRVSAARRQSEPDQPLEFPGNKAASIACHAIVLSAAPYDGVAHLIAGIMSTRSVFDKSFVALYEQRFFSQFGLDAATAGTNNFWLTYCYVIENSRVLGTRVANWQTLYGFARNLATSFFMAFCYSWFWLRLHKTELQASQDFDLLVLFAIPFVFYALALVLLLRYYYLYRAYYTKFILRAFVYCTGAPAPAEKRSGLSASPSIV